MNKGTNRRTFIKASAAAGVGFWVAGGVAPRPSRAAIDEISFASIGVGGKGDSDSKDAGEHGNLIAICDIDDNTLKKKGAFFPKAKQFNDYRKMLDEMAKSIDAVTVSTPDHNHAPASVRAMRMGLNCFTQKPMTHTLTESRLMGQIARDKGLCTQMGNQGTADSTLRTSAALVKSGAIGTVKEIHVWTNRPVWPQGEAAPEGEPAPSHVHWNEWLGPAEEREYSPLYHPFKWRGWWDFGTGALGDMACHTLNMPFMALGLFTCTSVKATCSGHNKQSYPKWSVIEYEFAAEGDRPAVKMTWYDGGKKPPLELLPTKEQLGVTAEQYSKSDLGGVIDRGSLLIGSQGTLFSPGDYGGDRRTGILAGGEYTLQDKMKDVEFTRSPGHFTEFANAIKEGKPSLAVSNFPEYATPLTEVVLLGNLGVWVADKGEGKKIEWDAKELKATNAPEVAHIVNKDYREGWGIDAEA